MKTYLPILVTIGFSVVGVAGDYLLKLASAQKDPLRSGWFQIVGPCGCDHTIEAPAAPTAAPRTAEAAPVVSSPRRVMMCSGPSMVITASYLKRVTNPVAFSI